MPTAPVADPVTWVPKVKDVKVGAAVVVVVAVVAVPVLLVLEKTRAVTRGVESSFFSGVQETKVKKKRETKIRFNF